MLTKLAQAVLGVADVASRLKPKLSAQPAAVAPPQYDASAEQQQRLAAEYNAQQQQQRYAIEQQRDYEYDTATDAPPADLPADAPLPDAACEAASRHLSLWDILPAELNHPTLGAFGRLDVDTTGLILMGTDGGLQSLLMHPSCGCKKVYLATLRVRSSLRLHATATEEFASGVRLSNGHCCRPACLEIVETVCDPEGGNDPFPSLGARSAAPMRPLPNAPARITSR